MKRLGNVNRISQGKAIIDSETDSPPDIGTAVINDQLSQVGEIVDIIGPTTSPFVVLMPDSGIHPPDLLGETLYTRD
ncbi:MAG: H/ACA ribonucleoprotein complex subunit GAR1 [Halobacteriaceae archaeon]